MELSYRISREYRVEDAEFARKLAMTGHKDAEIANMFGVSLATFMDWCDRYDELAASLWAGRALADANVAESLYKRAVGYSCPATKFFKVGRPGEETIHCETYIQYYPPDTNAAIFWLKNRQPQYWRDQSHQALTDAEGNTITPPTIIIQPVRSNVA